MSVTSADPDDLGTFVDASDRLTDRFDSRIAALQRRERSVAAACEYNHPTTPSLPAARQLHGHWVENADFVRTIRDELLEADRYDADGNPLVDDRSVEQSLTAAGLTRSPGAIDISPVEMLGDPPYSGFVDDPICLANGNFILEETDLPMHGIAEALSTRRVYNSRDDRGGLFGHRWSSLLDSSLLIGDDRITHRGPDGGSFTYRRRTDGAWSDDPRRRRRIRETDDGWAIDERHERTWLFDHDGALTGLVDGPARIRVETDDHAITLHEELTGRSIRHELDPTGTRITAARSSDGRRVVYHHDDQHLVRVERDVGDMTYEIDDAGFLAAGTDADGVTLFRNTYDPDGWVLSQIEHHGRETRYDYRPDGVSTVTATDGSPPNIMVHDRRGRMTAMIDGLGHTMRMAYDDRDNLVQLVDRTGAVTRFHHDDHGNVIERVDPDGLGERFEWDTLDRLITHTDRAGTTITHRYEGDNREPASSRLPDGSEVRSDHDEHGLLRTVTDADGIVLTLERDPTGTPTAVLDATGRTLIRLDHDRAGRVVEATVGDRTATAELDAAGRILALTTPEGTHRFGHTPAGRVREFLEASGARWRYERDPSGDVRTITDDDGILTRFERDGVGDVIAEIDATGGRTVYERDPLGRPVAIVDGAGNRTEHRHDAEGRIVATIDAAGQRYTRERDALGRITAEIDPSGSRTEFTYHPNGEVATETDAEGHTWRHEIDDLGHTRALIDPTGAETTLRYSPTGNLLELRTPAGRITRNVFDETGRHVAVIGPDGVEQPVDPDTGTAGDDPDLGPAMRRRTGPQPESTAVGPDARFHHDARGRLIEAIDPAGILTRFVLDDAGRLEETVTGTVGMSYTHDGAGRLTSITDPHDRRTEFHRGAFGGITRIEHPDGSSQHLDRDVDGRLHRISSEPGPERIEMQRDRRGLITGITDHRGTIRIDHDPVGRVTAITDDLGPLTFELDPDDVLVAIADPDHRIGFERGPDATPTGVALDDRPIIPAPAPTEAERDDAGRIVVDEDGRRFGYDLAGRLASVTVHDRTTTFDYDDLGLLSTEHHPDGVRTHRHGPAGEILSLTETDGTETTYLYDLLGRRIGEQRGDGSQRSYRWDGLGRLTGFTDTDPAGRRREHTIERDPIGRPMRIDGTPIRWADPMGLEVHGIGDRRYARIGAHIRDLTDPTDNWSRRVGDDPWGTDDGTGVRLGHRGHLAVGDLVLMGARVYHPATRSFLTMDPLPSVPGRVSYAGLYQYAWCDPVNHLDPTGRRPLSDEEYAQWQEDNSKGWVRKNWKSIAIAAGATIIGGVLLVATGGTGAILIGAAVGAAAGGLDAAVHGGSTADIIQGAVIGGLVGGLTGGAGRVFRSMTYPSAPPIAQRIAYSSAARNAITGYGGAYAEAGLDYGASRLRGQDVEFDPFLPAVTGTISMAGGMVVDRYTPPIDAGTPHGLKKVDGIGDVLSDRVARVRAAKNRPLTYEELIQIDQIGPVRARAIMDAKMN